MPDLSNFNLPVKVGQSSRAQSSHDIGVTEVTRQCGLLFYNIHLSWKNHTHWRS